MSQFDSNPQNSHQSRQDTGDIDDDFGLPGRLAMIRACQDDHGNLKVGKFIVTVIFCLFALLIVKALFGV